LTIKSTSHTTPPIPAGKLQTTSGFSGCERYFRSSRHRRYNCRRHNNLCFVMPVNIQLSKISIASAIS